MSIAARMNSPERTPRDAGFASSQSRRPKVILCVAKSDPHVVANQLIAMFLRDNGFDVVNLGACTPLEEIMSACQRHPDAIAVLVGSMNGHAVEDLRGLATEKRRFQVRIPVFVGGNLSVGATKTGEAAATLLRDGVQAILDDVDALPALLRSLAAGEPLRAT